MKIIYFLVIFMALLSCKKDNQKVNEIEIRIINNSELKLDSAKVYTTAGDCCTCDSIIIKAIEPKTEATTQWHDVTTCESDGEYLIKVFFEERLIEKTFGYYTNGILLDKQISISTYSDSINVTSVIK